MIPGEGRARREAINEQEIDAGRTGPDAEALQQVSLPRVGPLHFFHTLDCDLGRCCEQVVFLSSIELVEKGSSSLRHWGFALWPIYLGDTLQPVTDLFQLGWSHWLHSP